MGMRNQSHFDLADSGDVLIPDPGTGVALPASLDGTLGLVIAASTAETNTLADPPGPGITLILCARTVGASGTRAVTLASAYDPAGRTVMTFSVAGQIAVLNSIPVGSAYKWKSVGIQEPSGAGPLQRNEINTAITTAGAGTLTAAALVGGVVTRTGPTVAYTDTTDTAVLIIAALPSAAVGQSWEVVIKNTVAFTSTLAAASGVTLSGQTLIPPNSVGRFLLTYSAAGAVTMVGLNIAPMTTNPIEAITALTTIGAGTITAAGIAGGVTNRTGSTAAYTDTTATADQIIAARPNANIGDAWEYTYFNNTLAVGTLTGASGVTVSGMTLVPQCQWVKFLVTYTAASTITMVGIGGGENVPLPNSKYSTAALSSTAASAGQLTGAKNVFMNNSGGTPGTYTTRTGAQMFGDIPNCQIGFTYTLFLSNGQGTGTLTLAGPDGSVTITGTATVAINIVRVYQVTFTSATAVTLQNIGTLAFS